MTDTHPSIPSLYPSRDETIPAPPRLPTFGECWDERLDRDTVPVSGAPASGVWLKPARGEWA